MPTLTLTFARDTSQDIITTPTEPETPAATIIVQKGILQDSNGNFFIPYVGEEVEQVTILPSSGTIYLTDNSVNRITIDGTTTFVLPIVNDNEVFHQILVQLNMGVVRTLALGTTAFFNETAPDLSNPGSYNLIYEHDGTNWVVGSFIRGETSDSGSSGSTPPSSPDPI